MFFLGSTFSVQASHASRMVKAWSGSELHEAGGLVLKDIGAQVMLKSRSLGKNVEEAWKG